MATAMMIAACPIGCGTPLKETDIVLAEGPLRRCPACGQLVSSCSRERFQESMAEFDAPDGTLPTGRNAVRFGQRMRRILTRAAEIIGKAPTELKLLDVGCSSGALLAVARDAGLHVQGVEPAPHAAATAKAQGFAVHTGLLTDAGFADATFDIVTLIEVIEHLPEPLALMREIHRVLTPGGLCMIGTGNADSWTVRFLGPRWEYFDIGCHGGHISFFNPQSIRLLAERSGFAVRSIQTRRVNLAERKDVSQPVYQLAKLGRELLALPARWLGKGHDMLAILQK